MYTLYLLLAGCPHSDPAAPTDHRPAAARAYAAQDWPTFVTHQAALVAADPDDLGERYNLACGYARVGDRDAAMAQLRLLRDRGVDFGAGRDPDLESLRGDPGFQALLTELAALWTPVRHAEAAFAVTDAPDLAAEGMAHDPATGRFFVGSMRTGDVFVVRDGVAAPFARVTVEGAEVSAVGMAVDPVRGRLWVAATSTDLHTSGAATGATALVGLDLSTGEPRESFVRPPGGSGFGFNDVAVGPDGSLYLTGTDLYVVRPGDVAPSVLPVDPPFRSSNGIAVGPDAIYVAGDGRISRIDLERFVRTPLVTPAGIDLRGFDGMYWVDGSLVGVQRGLGPWRVVRVDLNPAGTAATRVEVLEQTNDAIHNPTTGAVVGPDLYFVARDPPPAGLDPSWGGATRVWRTPIRPPPTFTDEERAAVAGVLTAQAEAWNRGDLEGYMAGYARSPDLVFTSGGGIRRGFDETLARYRARYGSDPQTMGKLAFELLDVRPVGADGAVVLGRWTLTQTPNAGHGVFTVVMERRAGSWRVIHDHTSVDPAAAGQP
ncbi:MAG: DUF4440 domain-containing protein [Myxococcota bacterium]